MLKVIESFFAEVPNVPHDILFVGRILGWKTKAEQAVEAARKFLRSAGVGAQSNKAI